MSALQSCMGGFCPKRDRCPNYYAASEGQQPSERLCLHGDEIAFGVQSVAPAPAEEPAETEKQRNVHIRLADRLAQIEAMLTPEGVITEEVVAALGFTTRSRPAVLLRQLVVEGRAFEAGAGNVSKRYFPTAEARDAYVVAYRLEMASRRLVNCKEASQRYREALNPTLRRRPAGAPAVAKPKGRPSSGWNDAAPVVAPAKQSQPRVAIEPDYSKAKITIAPPLPDRYAVTSAAPVVDSRECRPWAQAVSA